VLAPHNVTIKVSLPTPPLLSLPTPPLLSPARAGQGDACMSWSVGDACMSWSVPIACCQARDELQSPHPTIEPQPLQVDTLRCCLRSACQHLRAQGEASAGALATSISRNRARALPTARALSTLMMEGAGARAQVL
jgi:hypothetical protein